MENSDSQYMHEAYRNELWRTKLQPTYYIYLLLVAKPLLEASSA